MSVLNYFTRGVSLALITIGIGYADISATYDPAGQQSVNASTLCAGTTTCIVGSQDFNSWNGGAFSTDFGTFNQITGSYSGGFRSSQAHQYGGAGGTGVYPEIFGRHLYTEALDGVRSTGRESFRLVVLSA